MEMKMNNFHFNYLIRGNLIFILIPEKWNVPTPKLGLYSSLVFKSHFDAEPIASEDMVILISIQVYSNSDSNLEPKAPLNPFTTRITGLG